MESKSGSILLLIAAIIGFIFSAIWLVFTILILFVSYDDTTSQVVVSIIFIFIFIFILVISILKLKASSMMKDSKKVREGGILGLVLGVISGDILSIIGGILGIVQADE